jgi:hypothetical protein
MPPLCEITATCPRVRFAGGSSGTSPASIAGLKVGASAAAVLVKPSPFGPLTAMSYLRAIAWTWRCSSGPVSPRSSAKPDDRMIAALMPALPQFSSSCGTNFAGMIMAARSVGGRSAIDR